MSGAEGCAGEMARLTSATYAQLRETEANLHAVTIERDELRDRLRGAVTSSPAKKEEQVPSDDPLHKEKNALRDQICEYLRTEVDRAEERVLKMEDEIAELADSAQAARREAQALANRTARAEADVETLGKQYDTTLGHIKKTHEAALAAQGKIDKEKLKREQAASEKAIKRLDQVARGALEV